MVVFLCMSGEQHNYKEYRETDGGNLPPDTKKEPLK